MQKHVEGVHDWILYRSESYKGGQIKFCAVGSREAARMEYPVVRGFRGTFPEVEQLVEELNAENATLRHYVRKEKEL